MIEYVIKYKFRGLDKKHFHAAAPMASIAMKMVANLRRYSDHIVVYITREPPIDEMFHKDDGNGNIFTFGDD